MNLNYVQILFSGKETKLLKTGTNVEQMRQHRKHQDQSNYPSVSQHAVIAVQFGMRFDPPKNEN